MGLLLAIAAALRLWRLGALGLEVDEGIQGLTVQGWLRSGLPLLPSGLVYQRAVPFSALQAISSWAFGLDEFALRLPAALFGVASVAATFALARALFGHRVAWVAATFIALSAWEIELSRYARFYTAFQVAWVLAFLCLFRALTQERARYWWGFAAAALAAVSVHELSILLAACLLLPLVDRHASWRTRATAVAAMIPLAVAWIAVRRGVGPLFTRLAPPHGLEILTSDAYTPGVLSGYPSMRIPGFDAIVEILRERPLILAVILTLILAAGVLIIRWRGPQGWRSTVLPIVAVALGAGHLFVLSGVALLLHVAWFGTSLRAFWSRALLPANAVLGLLLALWTVLLHRRLEGEVKAVVLALFGFPNVLQHFFYWFALGWPVFLATIVVTGIVMFDRFLRTGDRSMVYALGGIAAPILVASAYESFHESRYVFHVYPLLAIVFAWGLTRVAEAFSARPSAARRSQVVFATVVAIGFLVSSDVGARTWDPLVRTHGTPRDPMRSVISWSAYAGFHQDQEGPSRFVNANASEGDRVTVIATLHQLAVYHFYLGRIDASLGRPGDAHFHRLKNGRIVDRTTGSEVVFDPEQLVQRYGEGSVWLLADEVLLSDEVQELPTFVRSDARTIAGDATYRGRDGVTFVRRFP
jgi:4-amino-4-deoxy-L-arabinose transferase-like glycosyltransferase